MTQNNHYIPQFIMRRYEDKINRYNVKDGRYVVKKPKLNVFVEKGLYPNELEFRLSRLESGFANHIEQKGINISYLCKKHDFNGKHFIITYTVIR